MINNLTQKITLSLLLSLFIISSVTAEDLVFPEKISVTFNNEDTELYLTGATIREKFFLDIYAMAHYVSAETRLSSIKTHQQILQSPIRKQISMVFLRSLTATQIKDSLSSSIKNNTNNPEFSQISSSLDEFLRPITKDVEENDKFILQAYEDGTLVSIFQGKEISRIKNPIFIKALWSIWFGDNAVVDRDLLVNNLLTSSVMN